MGIKLIEHTDEKLVFASAVLINNRPTSAKGCQHHGGEVYVFHPFIKLDTDLVIQLMSTVSSIVKKQ